MISRESDLITTKQEESSNTSGGSKLSKPSSTTTTSSWSRLKDPRIVRVSRAFGGKDRHSKVCTVRGLRDRRVRLSVPTAIQLYDLQDRLGLNQPSKVVDWLLNAAKHEIDELPPLQIPQGSIINQNLQPFLDSQSAKQGLRINDTWGKSKGLFLGETSESREENWERSTDQEFQENHQGTYSFSSNNLIPKQNNHPSLTPNLLNSGSNSGGGVPYNSFVRWDPSNLTLSQPQRSHGLLAQPNFSLSSLQSTPPFLVYQHGISTHNYFPSQIAPMDSEFALKQLNFQSSSITTSHVDSTSQPVRPFHFGMTADLLPRSEEDKDDEFH